MMMNKLALAATLALAAGTAQAQLSLSFSDHTETNSTYFTGASSTGEQTAVDQWTGIAGNGWTTPWQIETFGSNQREARVIELVPDSGLSLVDGDDKYLTLRHIEQNSTSARQLYAVRSYGNFGNVDVTQPAFTQFYYRVDVSTAFAQGGVTFADLRDGGALGSLAGTTWNIRTTTGTTKRWELRDGFGTGDNLDVIPIDTGMTINDGDIYEFTIFSDPTTNTWDVVITNISTGEIYDNRLDANVEANELGYVDNTNALGGKLIFGSQIGGVERFDSSGNLLDDTLFSAYNISLDEINITTATPTVGECAADLNKDGVLDAIDVTDFLNLLDQGCPLF